MLHIMNYSKIYQNLISKGNGRKKEVGLEWHHIIPFSIGGSNDKGNLVYFTTREHYIAHKLLVRIYKNEDRKKMIYALWWMSKTRHNPEFGNVVTSRDYEKARRLYIENHPNRDAARKERYRQRRADGLHKTNEKQHSETVKKMLSAMTIEQRTQRMRKSALSCNQEERAIAIRKGKSSTIKLTRFDGEVIIFDSIDKDKVKLITGVYWHQLLYRLKRYGTLVTGEKVEYLHQYTHKGRYGTAINHG